MLSDENWSAVSVDEAWHAFLKTEWDKWSPLTQWVDRRLVMEPNIDDLVENRLRASLIAALRGPLLQRLPTDTQWFKVNFLRDEHLPELRVIGRCGLDSPADENEVLEVAKRRPRPLIKTQMPLWEPPMLWGHSKAGPFTILEGNHRLIAYAGSQRRAAALAMPCYVGLSSQPCYWHLADQFSARG